MTSTQTYPKNVRHFSSFSVSGYWFSSNIVTLEDAIHVKAVHVSPPEQPIFPFLAQSITLQMVKE